jgi:hypothetical protein
MNRLAFVLWLLFSNLLLNGCREVKGDEYFALSGQVFIFNYRIATATYVVTLDRLRPVPEGSVAVADFENPDGGEALTVEEKIWPKAQKISFESPPLSCVVKDRPYTISIKIMNGEGKILQKIESTLRSTLDQTVLPDRPLVIGQSYEANPEMAGHPDGKLPLVAKVKCPAQNSL